MLRHTAVRAALLTLAAALACTDRQPPTAPRGGPGPLAPAATASPPAPEPLARALALALGTPEFRAYVKAGLDASPYREHKLQFQRFLRAGSGRALTALARATGVSEADFARLADSSLALEMYLPVPAHRRAWAGDANLLVATAIQDHDAPIAFDVRGNRSVLSADRPPATPVIALVPVETDFTVPPEPLMYCGDLCTGGGGGGGGTISGSVTPEPGLYMTQSHFVDDFEGWLKGSPEFEVHILGQKGTSDSLTDYQCAGEHQPVPYYFDQNDLDWSGSVMLFSKIQIDNYNAAHPGQNMRVFVVEDDDTACQIKNDPNRIANLFKAVDGAYKALTAGKDSTTSSVTWIWKVAKAIQQLWSAVASLINTNDELVGDAVQDSVVGEYHSGYNWIVKGENNVTNGWIKLETR